MDKTIVIGTGPAGIMAALTAANNGQSVILIEKNNAPAKKLSISGSGQCNLTHSGNLSSFSKHYGDKTKAALHILKRFSNKDLLVFFKELGLTLQERDDGKYFPQTFKSSDVIDCLLKYMKSKQVQLKLNNPVLSLQKIEDRFIVTTFMDRYTAKNVICATGGFTYPKTGSDGSFFDILKKLGHQIIPLGKGLTPVISDDKQLQCLSGISLINAGLTFQTNRRSYNLRGELLVTHRGFSGPLIIDNSRYFEKGMLIQLNFTSFNNSLLLEKQLIKQASIDGRKKAATFFYEIDMPKRLVNTLFSIAKIDREIPLSHLSKEKRKKILHLFTAYPIIIKRLGDLNESMVTTGGIDLSELKLSTMESKIVENMYFCGEMIDIDGDTGGYNIQMAFSTGFIAGKSVSQRS